MRNLFFSIPLLAMVACATGNEITPKSEWSKLKEAKTTRCKDWPMGEDDLEIRDIKVTPVAGVSFVVSALARSGEPIFYLAPFQGKVSLDRDDQKVVAFGKKAVPLGASIVRGTPTAWLGQSDVDGHGFVELRSLLDNTVIAKTQLKGHLIQEGDAIPDEHGSWLFYKGARFLDDGSMEAYGDGYSVAAHGELGKAGLGVQGFDQLKFQGQPKIAASNGKALVVWPRTIKRDSQFFVKEIAANGKTLSSGSISLKVTDLEGWAVAAMPNETLLAYVEGDSLVGNASLQIVRFVANEMGVKVVSTKRFQFANQHVSDPVWVVRNGEAYLMLLTWVDEESTAAIVKVTAAEVKEPVLSGIFKKGSRIGGAFADPKTGDLLSIMRYRDGMTWKWQLCLADRG